eukprot:TRINITY_DN426_c0_g1_i3.p1 TRINITY_DN426_c0_g1~~TRINITY_DN426_c0_g1_i3.p1  ORF type:complete len:465 (-),score=105.38 TRINITY_DN426_c0_g1_i3:183-1577(-)
MFNEPETEGAAIEVRNVLMECTLFTLVAPDGRRWSSVQRPSSWLAAWWSGVDSHNVAWLQVPNPSLPLITFYPADEPSTAAAPVVAHCRPALYGERVLLWSKGSSGSECFLVLVKKQLEWVKKTANPVFNLEETLNRLFVIQGKPAGTPLMLEDHVQLEAFRYKGNFVSFDDDGTLKVAPHTDEQEPPSFTITSTDFIVLPHVRPPRPTNQPPSRPAVAVEATPVAAAEAATASVAAPPRPQKAAPRAAPQSHNTPQPGYAPPQPTYTPEPLAYAPQQAYAQQQQYNYTPQAGFPSQQTQQWQQPQQQQQWQQPQQQQQWQQVGYPAYQDQAFPPEMALPASPAPVPPLPQRNAPKPAPAMSTGRNTYVAPQAFAFPADDLEEAPPPPPLPPKAPSQQNTFEQKVAEKVAEKAVDAAATAAVNRYSNNPDQFISDAQTVGRVGMKVAQNEHVQLYLPGHCVRSC